MSDNNNHIIKVEKKYVYSDKLVHRVWLEWIQSRQPFDNPIIGKYQYVISNEQGEEISLVELPNYFRDGVTLWEIYCLKGDLFDDIERFNTYDEAVQAAKKYLEK